MHAGARVDVADRSQEVAFQPVIQAQGSDEQHEEWMAKCQNHEILGCYLQTELAHGSNVQRTLWTLYLRSLGRA